MRGRGLKRVGDATEHHKVNAVRPKLLLMLVLIVTVLTGVVYFLLTIKHNYIQPPFGPLMRPPIENLAVKLTTQMSATTTLPSSLSNAKHLHVSPNAHSLAYTSSVLPLTTKLPTMPSTSRPFMFHSNDTDLSHGDSNLPYPSSTLENLMSPPSRIFKEESREPEGNTSLKKILFWNDNFSDRHFGFGFGREPFLIAGCRVNTCTTTANRTRYPLEEIDAIIWHFRAKDNSLPKYRSSHTRYVFWLMESPVYLFGDLRGYKDVFNWTFTYRLDSDFLLRYNQVFRRRHPLPMTDHNYAAGKTKLVAWFVSHCSTDSGRITLTRTLQEYIPVDVFGACGPFACPRRFTKDCYGMLNATYKFYLAFENSLCRDYITEKFFNVLRLDVVPVVFGSGNYSAMAPPHSYIDALSFPSVGALANHLLYLNHNDTAYNEYFRWKRFHKFFDFWALTSQQYCSLCESLHYDNTPKTYDMYKWYVEDAHCKSKFSPDIYDFISGTSHINTLTIKWCLMMSSLLTCAWVSHYFPN